MSAQVWADPAEIAATPLSTSVAGGAARSYGVPSPSWPNEFRPQQRTQPPAGRAEAWPARLLRQPATRTAGAQGRVVAGPGRHRRHAADDVGGGRGGAAVRRSV